MCGCSVALDFNVVQHNYGFYDVFANPHGSLAQVIVHEKEDVWFAANGKTLLERDTWQTIYEPNGFRIILFAHIQGPGGLVLRDAGQIIFNYPDDPAAVFGPFSVRAPVRPSRL